VYREDTIKRAELLAERLKDISPLEMSQYTIKTIAIRSEMIKRDLTKRQYNILATIFILSYMKDYAIIPKLMDFELSGVSKTLIKKELDKLVEMSVITWDKCNNHFSINDPMVWDAPYHYGYSNQRAEELFQLNLNQIGKERHDVNV
jgi:hypothetical protein